MAGDRHVSRRAFVVGAGGVAVGGAVAGRLLWGSLVGDHVEEALSSTSPPIGTEPPATGAVAPPGTAAASPTGRVLVVVQLGGGNDGLNTLVPAGDGAYFDARPTLRVAEGDVLALSGTDRYGFHPSLAPLVPYWQAGELVAVDAVGLPGQTRSHFAAMDAWWSARPGQALHSGWIGRWLDVSGDTTNPLRAIALGGASSALLAAKTMSTVVLDPSAFALRTPKGADGKAIHDAILATAAPLASDSVLAQAQGAVPAALDAVDLLAQAQAGAAGTDGGAQPNDDQSVAGLLRTAAGIIDLGIGTQVIVVAVSGFDTHADQANRHPALLKDTAEGIAGFLDLMKQQGRQDEVLVMTTSEFGRRVQENGGGTDHGNGGVQFLAGPMVRGGQVVGQADLGVLDQGDLRSTLDARSLYANALDWLSGPAGPTDEVLEGSYDRMDLLRSA